MNTHISAKSCYTSKEYTANINSIRGLMAIMIVMGHTALHMDKAPVLFMMMHKLSMLIVCYFFFVSAWGMVQSYHHNANYLKGFLPRKCFGILKLAIAALIITELVYTLIMGRYEDFSSVTAWVESLYTRTNWYIFEMLFFYLVFYAVFYAVFCIAYRMSNGKGTNVTDGIIKLRRMRVLLVTVITIVAMVILIATGMEKPYYISILAFPWGIIISEYWDCVSEWMSKRKILVIIAALICAAIGAYGIKLPDSSYIGIVLKNLCGIASVTLIAVAAGHIYLRGRIIKYLTGISGWMYVLQFPILDAIDYIFEKNSLTIGVLYAVAVLIVDIVISSLFYGTSVYFKQWRARWKSR